MNKTMIMVAPNGARRTKKDHPNLPVSEAEVIKEAGKCIKAGASVLHAHVRDGKVKHVLDAERYKRLITIAEKELGDSMITQITTEAVGVFSPAQQMAVVKDVKPAAVSIALKEIIPDADSEEDGQAFFEWLKANDVSPQFILYDAAEVDRFFQLQERGVIAFSNPFLLFVLGRYTKNQQSDPKDLAPFVAALKGHKANWAVCAFGKREAECALAGARAGGHVRIGFENNLFMPGGQIAKDNAATVGACAEMLKQENFEIMDAHDAATLLRESLR